jgi:CRP-like cAMP-binding protein
MWIGLAMGIEIALAVVDEHAFGVGIKFGCRLIGSTRVTVTRLLGELRDQGMISINKKKITVHNPILLGQKFA